MVASTGSRCLGGRYCAESDDHDSQVGYLTVVIVGFCAVSTPQAPAAWHTLSGEEFATAIDSAYDQIVHWKSNLFKVPSGASGKRFVGELMRLFSAFATESMLEAIAIKVAMTMRWHCYCRNLMRSPRREHITCLSRRLALWGKETSRSC